jgi:hypothetical protein
MAASQPSPLSTSPASSPDSAAVTEPVTADSIPLHTFREHFECRRDSAEATLARFRSKLADDPAHALEWSLDAFEAAAARAVCCTVIASIYRGTTAADLLDRALHAALIGARSGSRSTSPASNLMEQCMTAEWARVASDLGGRS